MTPASKAAASAARPGASATGSRARRSRSRGRRSRSRCPRGSRAASWKASPCLPAWLAEPRPLKAACAPASRPATGRAPARLARPLAKAPRATALRRLEQGSIFALSPRAQRPPPPPASAASRSAELHRGQRRVRPGPSSAAPRSRRRRGSGPPKAAAVAVHDPLRCVGGHADGADLVRPSFAFASTAATRSAGRRKSRAAPSRCGQPGLERGVGAQHRGGVGFRKRRSMRSRALAEPVEVVGQRQPAVRVGQLLAVVLEPVAPGRVLQEEAGQPHLRDPVLPEERRREAERARQIAKRRCAGAARAGRAAGRRASSGPARRSAAGRAAPPRAPGIPPTAARAVRRCGDARHHRPEGDVGEPSAACVASAATSRRRTYEPWASI